MTPPAPPFPNSKTKGLSVVMIGRDEEAIVGNALEATRGLVDEVIFVDTGSVDSTIHIVERFGAHLFTFEWCNDFSKAKNFGLEQANYSWILNIDCDEILEREGFPEFLEIIKQDAFTPAYSVHIKNILDDGSSHPSQALRLFRNAPKIRFRNPVHESIGEALFEFFPDSPPKTSPVTLQHYGYTSQRKSGKKSRNLQILENWIGNEPTNIYANYKLGQIYAGMNRVQDAEGCFARAFEGLDQTSFRESYAFAPTFVESYLEFLIQHGLTDRELEIRNRIQAWS